MSAMRPKLVIITTTIKGNHLGYRIAVTIDGAFAYDKTATPGQVVAFRNRETEHWSRFADSVEANAIPTIAGLTTGAVEAARRVRGVFDGHRPTPEQCTERDAHESKLLRQFEGIPPE